MDYNRQLYEATAHLLMLQFFMNGYDTVISRYIYDKSEVWKDDKVKAVDSIAILLSLGRISEYMPADIIDKLEHNIAELASEDFPQRDRDSVKSDLETARNVIDWYRTTPGKMT